MQIHPEPTPITKIATSTYTIGTPQTIKQSKITSIHQQQKKFHLFKTVTSPFQDHHRLNDNRFHQHSSHFKFLHIPEFNTQRPPLLPRPSYQHQNFLTGPYPQHQQPQGHYTQQPYVPIVNIDSITIN